VYLTYFHASSRTVFIHVTLNLYDYHTESARNLARFLLKAIKIRSFF